MNIGIIGSGHIGGALTLRLRELNRAVSVANSRGPQTLEDLAKETGATPVTVEDATRHRDVVIVTIPEKCIQDLPTDLFEGVPESVVVVDTGNY
jgi:predicted dinucleotide-binding enzyme